MLRFLLYRAIGLAIACSSIAGAHAQTPKAAASPDTTPATETAPASETNSTPSTTPAPDADTAPAARHPVAYRAFILDALIGDMGPQVRKSRRRHGWTSLATGALLIGMGGWRVAGENKDDDQFQRGLGVMFISIGGVSLADGATSIARDRHEERLFRRWQEIPPHSLDAVELARFEGELEALSYARSRERRISRWLGLTRGLGGVLIFGLVPIPDLNTDSRVTGYIVGAVFTATGLLRFGLSFRESAPETLWKRYQQLTDEPPRLSFDVGAERGGGMRLSLSGRF